ncbi:MAG: LON peptidase substrate-binding domain-containing protein [Aquisalimonadaceae bacterium]
MTTPLALFPLRTVLFPGGPLQLRIFEARYLDMVSQCLRDSTGFGVCLIEEGSEVGQPARPCKIGTLARIVDWDKRRDGLLGITAVGEQRFRIRKTWATRDRLLMAEVDELPLVGPDTLSPQPELIHSLIERVLELKGLGYEHVAVQWESAHWLSCRLAEVLPLDLEFKQHLLEMDSPRDRLRALVPLLPALVCDPPP